MQESDWEDTLSAALIVMHGSFKGYPSQHDWKIDDWDIKLHQNKETNKNALYDRIISSKG